MKVYLLYAQHPHMGHMLLGVFATEKIAMKHYKSIIDKHWGCPEIKEFTVVESLE